MPAFTTKSQLTTVAPSCPLNDGLAVLDQLMAGLSLAQESRALDLALDLRHALRSAAPAEAVIALFFKLRDTIEERHYLPCYRLRRWLQGRVKAWVRLDRQQPPIAAAVTLDQADLNALRDFCLATTAVTISPGASVRFEIVEPR